MPIDLYHIEGSAPCRAVRMAAKEAGVELNLIPTNLMEGEHLKPEFLKLNPQHTVPTLVDGDLSMGESRAQMCYLMNKYAPDNKVYPKCPKKRALVDRYLYFDMGTLYKAISEVCYPKLFRGEEAEKEKVDKLNETLKFVEAFLGDKKYLVGDDYTLADLSISASLTVMEAAKVPIESKVVCDYYNRLKEIRYWKEINMAGIEMLKALAEKMKKK